MRAVERMSAGALMAAGELIVWRLERARYLPNWRSAAGALQVGGRWSSAGKRVLYTSIDPATTILEVAVHKGFDVLDTVAHDLLKLRISPGAGFVVHPSEIANPNWLRPGVISPNQQQFGDALLAQHPVVVLPSAVSTHSWNVLINVSSAAGHFEWVRHERLALDPRRVA